MNHRIRITLASQEAGPSVDLLFSENSLAVAAGGGDHAAALIRQSISDDLFAAVVLLLKNSRPKLQAEGAPAPYKPNP